MFFGLKQTLTYWAPTGEDAFGGKTFATPVSIKGRAEDRYENIYDTYGRQVLSKARFFTATQIQPLGYIYFGSSVTADPRKQIGAEEIRIVTTTPDIATLKTLYTGFI
jgi:hypothetical protein